MSKVVIFPTKYEAMCSEAVDYIRSKGHEVVFFHGKSSHVSADKMIEFTKDADGTIVGMGECTESVFKESPNLKAIVKFGVGVDNIDLEAAKNHGIKVANAPGCNSNAVADLTVSLILDIVRNVSGLVEDLHNGIWSRNIGMEIEGKTVGLIGYGAIAQLVSKKLKGFDCNMIAYDIYPNYKKAEENGVSFVSLEELFSRSDIISIHAPGTAENYHLIDEESFRKMKKGVFIVNCARGSLMDSPALLKAIDNGIVARAAVDVFEIEPISPDDPITKNKKVFCTPHTAGETFESYKKLGMITAKALCDILDGQEPDSWVNR